MSISTTNRFLIRENSQSQQSYDGSFYSDTNSIKSHHNSYYEDDQHLEHNLSERNLFYTDHRPRNFGDIFEGGSDYCSTCPSEDYYTDSLSDSE